MSTTTTNYKFIKPQLTDAADITATNENWDKIDSELASKFELGGVYTGDMNELVLPGQYRVQSNTNLPSKAYYSQVFVGRSVVNGGNNDTLCQIAVSYQEKRLFHRGAILRNGVWDFEEWSECYTTNNKPNATDVLAKSLVGGTNIPNNSDLDDYKTPGNYHCIGDYNATTMLNCPVTNAFTLAVGYPTGSTAYICQEVVNWVSGVRYYRTCLASADTWSNWTFNLTEDHVVDDLTSTSTNEPLSANQGRKLNEGKVGIFNKTLSSTPSTFKDGLIQIFSEMPTGAVSGYISAPYMGNVGYIGTKLDNNNGVFMMYAIDQLITIYCNNGTWTESLFKPTSDMVASEE